MSESNYVIEARPGCLDHFVSLDHSASLTLPSLFSVHYAGRVGETAMLVQEKMYHRASERLDGERRIIPVQYELGIWDKVMLTDEVDREFSLELLGFNGITAKLRFKVGE